MRGFQNAELFFKFGQVVLKIFEFLVLQKRGVFTILRENLFLSGMVPKRRFLMIFCNFLGINTHNFVKNDPKFKNRACFMEHFMELVMKKFLGPKAATFGIWSLKTSLGHLSQKMYFQTGPHFLQNHNMNPIKS